MDALLSEDATIYDDSLQNMKVVELKKELKARGLPVSGTKGELLERLQNAAAVTKESEVSAITDDDILDDSINPLDVSSSPIDVRPLKKRIIVNNDIAPTTPPEKKVSLNRANAISVPPSATPVKVKPVIAMTKTDDSKNKIAPKTMSVQEKLTMRAQRFNVTPATSTTALNTTTNNSSVKSNVLNMNTGSKAPNLDVLKKRAERFGENVSTVMRQLEAKEKVLKRKMRFGAAPAVLSTSNVDDPELKRLRAQRFGF